MDKKLSKVWKVAQELKREIKDIIGPDFSVDISIDACDINHPLAIEAKELEFRPGRRNEVVWYEKSDEHIGLTVFVE